MPDRIKSVFVAALYPLLYFMCQLFVQIVMIRIITYRYGWNINLLHKVNQKTYMITLYATALCLLILFILSRVRGQNLFDYYHTLSFRQMIAYGMSAVGLYGLIVIMNSFLIQFFPSYDDQIMGLFQLEQPFLTIFVIGIVAPLIEELIFRGEVFRELEKNFTTPVVILLQAILFGLVHPIPLQKIQTFVMGMFFGYVRARSRNLWYPTIMHITSNMIACFLVFFVV